MDGCGYAQSPPAVEPLLCNPWMISIVARWMRGRVVSARLLRFPASSDCIFTRHLAGPRVQSLRTRPLRGLPRYSPSRSGRRVHRYSEVLRFVIADELGHPVDPKAAEPQRIAYRTGRSSHSVADPHWGSGGSFLPASQASYSPEFGLYLHPRGVAACSLYGVPARCRVPSVFPSQGSPIQQLFTEPLLVRAATRPESRIDHRPRTPCYCPPPEGRAGRFRQPLAVSREARLYLRPHGAPACSRYGVPPTRRVPSVFPCALRV